MYTSAGSTAQLSVIDDERFTQRFVLGSGCFPIAVQGYLTVEPYERSMSILHRAQPCTLIAGQTEFLGYQELLRQQRQ
ncbi:hypothetical protein AWB82_05922 [Caballeronia glebae]|uniref:Uncharacterized protein n=1 Tax=Caballeronia glebae TaxID=1777143 RepID=A0A158CXB0_9BURK|nr:hypothetical protein AWB82_05922 [Caballeronia glebae]